jgi:DNA-binding transcriptional LysR family regulator
MRLTVAQLEAFYWVAQLGTFRAATRHLNLTQPSLSQRIKELEGSLGVMLFDRDSYRPRLTYDGSRILRDVEELLAVRDRIASRVSGTHGLSGRIRMGVAESFATTYYVAFSAALRAAHPELEVELSVDYSAKLEALVVDRELDFGVVTNPSALQQLSVEPQAYTELVWVCPNHVVRGKRMITPVELQGVPIITNPPPSNLSTSIARWFAEAGCVPHQTTTCGSLEVMRLLASAGIGAALLPLWTLQNAAPLSNATIHIPEPKIAPHVFCTIWHRMNDFAGAQQLSAIVGTILREHRLAGALSDEPKVSEMPLPQQ